MNGDNGLLIPETSPAAAKRIISVDILRGIVMVVMALDHTRDFFSDFKGDPLDFDHASAIMFFTRWITHFCAPVFIFLAGASAFLSLGRGKTKRQASWLLIKRGFWLVILELTVIHLGWSFNFDYNVIFVQVIWAIGWSMMFLGLLIFLPRPAILTIGLLIIFLHNAFDGVHGEIFGQWSVLWKILHQHGPVLLADKTVLIVIYPLVPWLGVMALGYCFGEVLLKPLHQRNEWLYAIGGSAIFLFIILRWLNIYGDPMPWHGQNTAGHTLLSFLRCEKYPPSLLYLFMTLGPAIFIMPMLEKMNGIMGRFFTVYGRVPLFYYVLHLFLIHTMAMVTGLLMGFPLSYFTNVDSLFNADLHWGFPLAGVYAFWAAVVLLLYYPCRWFMRLKQRHKKWWMSYI